MEKKIWQSYPTISAYTGERFPVGAISAYADDESYCILGDAPTISQVAEYYKTNELRDWLCSIIKHLCKMASVYADDAQITATADLVKKRYGHLKLTEVMLFSSKFIAGDYEQFFGKYDSQVILKSLNSYVMYRNNIRSRNDQDEKRKQSLTKVDGNTGLEHYQIMLQKAVYGDKDAMDALHLNTYEDIVRCVAMSIKMHGMPEKILDSIKPEYQELAQGIIKWDLKLTKNVNELMKQ